MIRFPTATLEGKKIPRAIFLIQPQPSRSEKEIYPFMRGVYELGAWCFDLPSPQHYKSFRELKISTGDESLIGLCHFDVEPSLSFLGKPIHYVEPKIISTIRKDFSLSPPIRNILPSSPPADVFTQREIDRITFDPFRFEKALSPIHPTDSPFLIIGEKYGEWLLALGRVDLLQEMVSRIRQKGFTPFFSCRWINFILPRAKSLDVAAFAIPINKTWNPAHLEQVSVLIRKLNKPVISLFPLYEKRFFKTFEATLSFLFDELKVYAVMLKVTSEEEARRIVGTLKRFPSLLTYRRT